MPEHQPDLPLGDGVTEPQLPVVQEQPPTTQPNAGALADLQTAAMTLPREQMQGALAEYEDRRKTFRDWLASVLIEGIHYGFPPGTEPTYDEQGRRLMKVRGGWKVADDKAWMPVKSLYQAGADFLCDLMGLAHEFTPDMESWEQGGSKPGHFFSICRLRSRQTNAVIGEGRGSHKVSDRKDENTALKMAQKSAKVAAVLNSYGLSDLFTQDLEDGAGQVPAHENPAADPNAAKVQPRDKRITAMQVNEVWTAYLAKFPDVEKIPNEKERCKVYREWIIGVAGKPIEWHPWNPEGWDRATFDKCMEALK